MENDKKSSLVMQRLGRIALVCLKLSLITLLPLALFLFLITPSLRFSPTSGHSRFEDYSPAQWVDVGAYRAYRTTILTEDNRALKIEYIAPENSLNNAPINLTIILAPLTDPDWLLQQVKPAGRNAVVIYRSPRFNRYMGTDWPTHTQLSTATRLSDYWNIAATNPLNKYYSFYMAMHEAAHDVVDIGLWAEKNINASPRNTSLIGIGSGALIAAAAAHKFEVIGAPVRKLALVYPPASLASAINDNLFTVPALLRKPCSYLLSFLYTRLHLKYHLPYVTQTQTYVLIPQNSFDLATYAAIPTLPLIASPTPTIEYLDVGYQSILSDSLNQAIRSHVSKWLFRTNTITP